MKTYQFTNMYKHALTCSHMEFALTMHTKGLSQYLSHFPLFLQLPAAATCSEWATDGSKVLLGLRDGRLLELQVPKGTINTEKTFEVGEWI
jgi:hypothetical protein